MKTHPKRNQRLKQDCPKRNTDAGDESISNIKIAGSDITIGYEMATAIYYEDYAKVMNTN